MKRVLRWLGAGLFAVAFVAALIAVWQPSNSRARGGWGGTAVVCGITAIVAALAYAEWPNHGDTDGPAA